MAETIFMLILRHHLPFLHSFLHRGVVEVSRDYHSMCRRDRSDIYCSYFLSEFTNKFFLVLFSAMVYIDRCNIHTTLWRSLIIFNSVKGPVNKEFENYCCFTVSTLFTFFSFLEIFLDFIKNFTNFIKMGSYIFLRSFGIIFMSGICHFPGPSATRNSFLILHFLKHSYSPNRILSTSILTIKFF